MRINNILQDKITNLSLWLTIFMLLLYSLLLIVSYHKLPPLLPIFNQMPWGIARIGTRIELLLPFGIAFIIFITNNITATYVYTKLPLIARMLCLTGLFASLLALLFLLRTLLVVLY